MSEQSRALKIGGGLLALVVIGLIAGFLLLGRDGNSPADNSTPSPTPTDVRTQVEQAYLGHWDVYADALLKLDASRLPEVLAGNALTTVTQQVEEQKRNNQPVRIRVEHDYRIVLTNDTTASIEDNYINHSVRLDPNTMQPIEKDPNQKVRKSYTLKKVNGSWKVTEIIAFR